MAKTAIQIKAIDQVATATEELWPGDIVEITGVLDKIDIQVAQNIPVGHKIAIREIKKNEEIFKYGEVIGKATGDIRSGYHVHVHNCWGLKGRRHEF